MVTFVAGLHKPNTASSHASQTLPVGRNIQEKFARIDEKSKEYNLYYLGYVMTSDHYTA